MPPTVIQSESLNSHFSLSIKDITPGSYTITLPVGSYYAARSFVGASTANWNGQGYLNLYLKNPNVSAPIESMYQIIDRFKIGCSGECWMEHALSFNLSAPTDCTLVAGFVDAPAGFVLKLFARV